MGRLFKFFLAVISTPFLISVSYALYDGLGKIYSLDENQRYFIWGVAVYLLVHIVLFKPNFLYIFGHELTHAFATFLSFGKVKSFKVSKKGGEVKTTKANIFINLAPYFFPTYAILLSLAWVIARKFWQVDDLIYGFLFLLGFSLMFHFVMTVEFLKTKQPDLIKSGYLFSLALIYLANISISAFIMSFVFPEVSFKSYLNISYAVAKDIYTLIFNQLFSIRTSS